MLKSSRHPYQVTSQPQPHIRTPWIEKPDSSTNSSCGSRNGPNPKNAIFQPTWLLPQEQTFSHQGPLLNQQVHPVVVQSLRPGSAISTIPGSSGAASTTVGVGSCGGQCIACETFCYYCLQVVFIAGILTGIALTIAGSVLHGSQRDGDLVVLMYIGVLLVLVCILLLSVHCCVRRNVKERKRALRMTLMESNRRGVHPSDLLVNNFFHEMPNTGPVYQPTTVSYEQQSEWRSPSGLFSEPNVSIRRTRCLQWTTLGLGVLAAISGLILVAAGSLAISNSESEVLTSDVIILIIGCILLLIGCVLVTVFVRHGNCKSGCPRLALKEKRIAHQMRDSQSVNGQTMNPSTDFLVSAQYAPVSEISYQTPAVSEEEETRKLMGSDNKDCNEDSERILDKDPRIVLRPLSKVEEFQDAEAF